LCLSSCYWFASELKFDLDPDFSLQDAEEIALAPAPPSGANLLLLLTRGNQETPRNCKAREKSKRESPLPINSAQAQHSARPRNEANEADMKRRKEEELGPKFFFPFFPFRLRYHTVYISELLKALIQVAC
jgi:hypothetical protein